MPGNVQNAVATAVFPWRLARQFTREQAWLVDGNDYRDGRQQRHSLTETARRRWTAAFRLTPADLTELRDFWLARRGPLEPFIFYDVFERAEEGEGWAYDLTGIAAGPGKYVVRFENDEFDAQAGLARSTVAIRLREVA